MAENIYEQAWQKYYEEKGLSWLASSHVYEIKQAFFAGLGAVEQLRVPDLLRADPRSAVAHPTSESTADNRPTKSATSG